MHNYLDFFFNHLAKPFIAVCLTLALCGFGYVGYMLITLPPAQHSGTNDIAMIPPPRGIAGGGTASTTTLTASLPSPTATSMPITAAQPTPSPIITIQPTQQAPATQPTPTPKPTRIPATPTPTPIPPQPSPSPPIQPGVNGNPWGYDFNPGTVITHPPAQFCQYFNCIPSFWQGNGYVEECQDGTYSLSGGIQGSCSFHGGDWRTLYQHH